MYLLGLLIDHFSGPGRVSGRVCVTINFELDNLWHRHLARRFNLILSRSFSKTQITGQSSWSSEEKDVAKVIGATLCEGLLSRYAMTVQWQEDRGERRLYCSYYMPRLGGTVHDIWRFFDTVPIRREVGMASHAPTCTYTHAHMHTYTRNRFMALFPGPTRWTGARRNKLLLDVMVQGKITEADILKIRLGATPSRLISDPPSSSPPIFTLDALPATTLPLYPGLWQAPSMLACIPSGFIDT